STNEASGNSRLLLVTVDYLIWDYHNSLVMTLMFVPDAANEFGHNGDVDLTINTCSRIWKLSQQYWVMIRGMRSALM
ncbi:hypothetical protein Tco_0060634, partial [Tanacetum coccineum]